MDMSRGRYPLWMFLDNGYAPAVRLLYFTHRESGMEQMKSRVKALGEIALRVENLEAMQQFYSVV